MLNKQVTEMDDSSEVQRRDLARLPLLISSSGAIVFIGSATLAGRLIWEQTVWTWERGPQMVGFSLLHVHPLFAIAGALSVLGIFVWSLIAVVLIAMRRKHVSRGEVGMLLCAVLIIVAMVLPDTLFAHVR